MNSPKKAPFGARFNAWWNGTPVSYDESDGATAGDQDAAARKQALREEARAIAALANAVPATNWPEERRKISQLVWGDGFIAPGGVTLATELSQPFMLDKSSSMIEIGAGMGGSTREIAAATGTYVTAFELEHELAEEGTAQAKTMDLDNKASIHTLDPENYEFKQNFYSGAMIHEALYQIEEKETMIESVVGSLKSGAQIVIWDLFFEEPASEGPLHEWVVGQKSNVYPWSHKAARQCLTDNNIDVRVGSDETERYSDMATDAWAEFVRQITKDPVSEEMIIPINHEVELWAQRTAAMKAGKLKLYRFAGIKRNEVV